MTLCFCHYRRLQGGSRQLAGEAWQENGLLFPSQVGTPLEERNVLRRFQAICALNGLPKLRLYDLRHTHASLLIQEGVHRKKISETAGPFFDQVDDGYVWAPV
jgi:integrase